MASGEYKRSKQVVIASPKGVAISLVSEIASSLRSLQ